MSFQAKTVDGKLWMGPDTFEIEMSLFDLNRSRLVDSLRQMNTRPRALVFLQGGSQIPVYDIDANYVFKQESYFMWTFGVLEPDCYGVIEVETGITHLFVPNIPDSYIVWDKPCYTLEGFRTMYKVDNVYYSNDLIAVLKKLRPGVILTLKGVNTNSNVELKPAWIKGIDKFNLDTKVLFHEMANLRVFKTNLEIEVMRYVIDTACAALKQVMRVVKPGVKDFQLRSEFLHYCSSVGGCVNVSSRCLRTSGPNIALINQGYEPDNDNHCLKDGNLCVFNMATSYFGYCADVTSTFPVNGKFKKDQKIIYEAVLATTLTVIKQVKPGVNWFDMHLLANRTLLEQLKQNGLLKGDVDEMINCGLAFVFQPYGLGYFLGLDVHDVGGYLDTLPPRPVKPRGASALGTSRTLVSGMVLTLEPGCYFIEYLLNQASREAATSKFLVMNVVNRFRKVGGVRIAETILVTFNGAEVLTNLPRTVEDIEYWINY